MSRTFKTIGLAFALTVGIMSATFAEENQSDAAERKLRQCIQRAVVALDDRATDLNIIARYAQDRCLNEIIGFLKAFPSDQGRKIVDIATTIVLEVRLPQEFVR